MSREGTPTRYRYYANPSPQLQESRQNNNTASQITPEVKNRPQQNSHIIEMDDDVLVRHRNEEDRIVFDVILPLLIGNRTIINIHNGEYAEAQDKAWARLFVRAVPPNVCDEVVICLAKIVTIYGWAVENFINPYPIFNRKFMALLGPVHLRDQMYEARHPNQRVMLHLFADLTNFTTDWCRISDLIQDMHPNRAHRFLATSVRLASTIFNTNPSYINMQVEFKMFKHFYYIRGLYIWAAYINSKHTNKFDEELDFKEQILIYTQPTEEPIINSIEKFVTDCNEIGLVLKCDRNPNEMVQILRRIAKATHDIAEETSPIYTLMFVE